MSRAVSEAFLRFVAALQSEHDAIFTLRLKGDASVAEPRDRRAVDVRKILSSASRLGPEDTGACFCLAFVRVAAVM